MPASWDLFFSYRRKDLDRARPLLRALTEEGISVWRDESQIPDQASITAEIRQAIAASKAFLAFYSGTYRDSNPCQQEITTAWLAAQELAPLPSSRIWIVNPEKTFDHIPTAFRDQRIPSLTPNSENLAAVVHALKTRLNALDATALGQGFRSRPAYFGMFPNQTKRFIGRLSELWDLHAMLTADRISIVTGVLGQPTLQVRGLGGNGKTLLAREYAIAFGPAYPGGVFWLTAYGHDDAAQSLNSEQHEALRLSQIREFAVQNGIPTSGLTPAGIETQFWQTIQKRNQRCLWIVDDVPSGLNQADFYRAWNAHWSGASTLITTRSKEYGALGSVLDLGVLSLHEALHLLHSHLQPRSAAEETAARDIVRLLGYHPLAVEVAGSYLAQGFDRFESYLDQLLNSNEDAVEFGAFLKQALPTGHERSIRATFCKSIRQLEPEGQEFLRLASVLAVAPIPVSLISEILDAPDGRKERSRKAVNQAEVLSLCERSGDENRTVHTLISRTMMSQFPDEGQTATLRSKAVGVLGGRLEKIGHIGEHAKISADLPHARYLLSQGVHGEAELKLASWLGYRDYERADYKPARNLQEQVLRASIKLFGEDDSNTLWAMQRLGLTLYESGDLPEARKLHESSLDSMRRLLGEDNFQTALAKHNLALTLHAQGHLAEAQKLGEEALATIRDLFGEQHAHTLSVMQNLAQTLYARGRLPDAENLQDKVLLLSRRLLGEHHPRTLLAANNVALTRYTLGRFAEAENLQREVLMASRRMAGEDHPTTLLAKNNLAQTLLALNRTAEGKSLLQEVLPASNRVLGERHPRTLTTMSNLALALSTEGDLAAARSLQEHVLDKTEELLGADHQDTIRAKNNLAETMRVLDDLTGARMLQEQVLESSLRMLGADHDLTLMAMNNLASTLFLQSDFAAAQTLMERVLEARRREFGEEHPHTLLALENLAESLKAQGDLAGAQKLQEKVLSLKSGALGECHAQTVLAMKTLVLTLLLQASELYSKATALFERHDVAGGLALGDQAEELSQRAKALEQRAAAIEGEQSEACNL